MVLCILSNFSSDRRQARKSRRCLVSIPSAGRFSFSLLAFAGSLSEIPTIGAHQSGALSSFRVDSIAYGFLAYLLISRAKIVWNNFSRLLSLILLIATTGVVILVNIQISSDGQEWWPRALYPYASAAFGIAAVLFFLSINSLVCWMSAACEFLGRISYPMYLIHLVILYVVARLGFATGLSGLLLYSFAVIVCSALFNYGFEQPILARRPRYKQKTSELLTLGMAPT